MAYEIVFHFHPRNEDGKYDTDQTLTFTRTIGRRKSEEVPLEKVAAAIMGEMARRDVWIINVEVFEFAKREVVFKETKGGCVIKNRKFQFSDLQGECQEVPDQQPVINTHVSAPMTQNRQEMLGGLQFMGGHSNGQVTSNAPPVQAGPIRQEVFRPSRQDLFALQQQGLRLTNNKPYPIFHETIKNTSRGPLLHYVISDDQGQRIEVNSMFFEPIRRGLEGIGPDVLPPTPEGRLSYVDTSPLAGDGGAAEMAAMIAAQDAAMARRR